MQIATAIALVAFGVAVVWGGYLWSKSGGGVHDEITSEFLVGLGRGLGLDHYSEREYFGEEIHVVSGAFRDLFVEIEVSNGNWTPYLRVVIEFDDALERDVNVFSDDRSGLVSYVQRVRELEIGAPDFDYEFLLYAPEPRAVEQLLPETTRDQMLRLVDRVDELRLTDQSLFLYESEQVSQDEVRAVAKKGVELAGRIQSTAETLGPRNPETSASQYEQATIEQAVRTETERSESTRTRSRSTRSS